MSLILPGELERRRLASPVRSENVRRRLNGNSFYSTSTAGTTRRQVSTTNGIDASNASTSSSRRSRSSPLVINASRGSPAASARAAAVISSPSESCSFLVDHIDGAVPHLAARDVTLTMVSRAPLATIEAFRKRMGWHFKWVSSFRRDLGHVPVQVRAHHDAQTSATFDGLAEGLPYTLSAAVSAFADLAGSAPPHCQSRISGMSSP
jgi:hypothetical protein